LKPIYVDIHIHTSLNPNSLNENYNVGQLLDKVNEVANGANFLISLSDHNTINRKAYIELVEKTDNVLLGCELHIKNYEEKKPYHCHIIFNVELIDIKVIDALNEKLNQLYPDKEVSKDTEKIPDIDKIIRTFDDYEFILLPHGGQSHSTFDESIKEGAKFDSTMERIIYYNQFEGFTARGNTGVEKTKRYFERLGINEFVNLITCTDNYNPQKYPDSKADDAEPFVPTWMLAEPTFDGLRLSLSESSRLKYSYEKPEKWSEYIEKVILNNEYVDINIDLTPGLNVVIGGSSSGKTLLVDSINNKLKNCFENCVYNNLGVESISISNPSGTIPHYISQNYIIKVLDNDQNNIEDIDLIKKVFPIDKDVIEKVRKALENFNSDICNLIDSVKAVEEESENIIRIPLLSRLVTHNKVIANPVIEILPKVDLISSLQYSDLKYNTHISNVTEIKDFLENNPLAENINEEIKIIISKINKVKNKIDFENKIREIIKNHKNEIDTYLHDIYKGDHEKEQKFEDLIISTKNYILSMEKFQKALKNISEYSVHITSKKIQVSGHTLYISNNFLLTKEKVLEIINKLLKTNKKIDDFDDITPKRLFSDNFKGQQPKVKDYDDFQERIISAFRKLNNRSYEIITKDDRKFHELSAGWKTSVLLDLILGYDKDIAPLIIDQPEDNLATNYINTDLIKSIKKIKSKKQIILVSHNATIPMLGDAQNIILCQNDGKIKIRSSGLEGKINGKLTLDYIAKITDGGKSSIKKRVKKYNLKNYRGEEQ
jgi:energy-coupling factor transporter ATP-binding protein EcfA2